MNCDVTSKEDWKSAWNEAEEVLGGKIEILCNNAGVPPNVSVRAKYYSIKLNCRNLNHVQAGMDTNLSVMSIGATTGITYAVERMSRSKGGEGGRIITTASVAGLVVSKKGTQ